MIDLNLSTHIIFSFLAAIGFAIFNSAPVVSLIPTGIIGTLGWVLYVILSRMGLDIMTSNFLAASLVAICGELLARIMKKPSTIFVIPGVIPLIPGLGLYNTMFYLVENKFSAAIATGTSTIFIGGAISLGVLVVSSIFRTYSIMRYVKFRHRS